MAQFLIFIAENEYYAIDLSKVLAISSAEMIVKASKQPKYIEGFAEVMGKNLPVLNMSRILGNRKILHKGLKSVMTIEVEGTKAGFAVDHIDEVILICEKSEIPSYITALEMGKLLSENQLKRIHTLGCN